MGRKSQGKAAAKTTAKKKASRDTSSAARSESDSAASRRTHEVLGILTLACALLVGPSLASVHFGDGNLMGPFGHLVGTLLHWTLGAMGYLVVLWLLLIALRIFAASVGISEPLATPVLWRKRIGMLLAIATGSMLAHLIGHPEILAGSSFGGATGEYGAELLSSLLSRPGTWVMVGTGLALSLVLATDFSWVRLGLQLARVCGQASREILVSLRRSPERLAGMARWVFEQLSYAHRRHTLAASAGGAAALPAPMPRVDLDQGGEPAARKTQKSPHAPMPHDLEIGGRSLNPAPVDTALPLSSLAECPAPAESATAEPVPAKPPRITRKTVKPTPNTAPEQAVAPAQSSPGVPAVPSVADEEENPALTIVQSRFRKKDDELSDETTLLEAPPANTKGYVLSHDAYRPPPLGLLEHHGEEQISIDEEAIQQQATRLTKTLADYKIYGKVTEVHPGPVVTMYEFVPAPGTRVSKVASLSNDLAMSLHAERVRIVAPIPGKGAIGIEVPNGNREVVSFKEIVADDAFRSSRKPGKLKLALGKNIAGAPVVVDLAKMPHLLVAGATGAGKSVSVNSMICSLLMRYTPEEVRLILIDPKFLELSGYNDIPHLLLPVVTDPKQASIALRWAVAEMERRYQVLADMRVRDICSYNRKVKRLLDEDDAEPTTDQEQLPFAQGTMTEATPAEVMRVNKNADGSSDVEVVQDGPASENTDETDETDDSSESKTAHAKRRKSKKGKGKDTPEPLPFLVVVIDEFADLMMVASKEVETSVARLAQKARACGIHLIVATQRPSVDVITGLIKANFPSRVAFQVASNHDSKTILGCYGAENLLGSGDMLVLDRGADMKRVHGAYISDEEISRVIEWLCDQGRPVYDMDILKAPEEEESQDNRSDEPQDALYDQAVALVAESRQASISMVQRRLRIGYNRAARLIEQMESEGIVGPPDGVRGREVLIEHHG